VTAVPPRLARYFEPSSATQELSGRLRDAGHRAYLVGGSVRDAFLDRVRAGSDIDVTTDARPDVIEGVVKGWADAVWLQGERFGTVGCQKGDDRFEITTFRAEIYRRDSRKPEVTYSDDITTDLSRRDFTINAIAIALDEPDLVDPHGGLDDLVARRLRTPLSPEISFGDDPLRMLRAARFVATLGFEPDAELLAAVEQMRERLRIISAERIRDELSKLLLADDPSAGLWLISRTRLSDEFLP
jgi:poly(A) polymerase